MPDLEDPLAYLHGGYGRWVISPTTVDGHGTSDRSHELLTGVVAPGGPTATVARQRFMFCFAPRRSSLSLAVGVTMAPAWSIPPRSWREGQVHGC